MLNSLSLSFVIIIFSLYFVLIPSIYVVKCLNAKGNWKRIVPPIITMGISVLFLVIFALDASVSAFYTLDRATGEMLKSYIASDAAYIDKTPFTLIKMFVFYNIPTWIMLTSYMLNYRNKKYRDHVQRMRIHDLN